MSARVGSDVESKCGKCGMTYHTVLAKTGEEIAKVQCNRCGAQHRYRPPGGTVKPARKRRTKKAPTPRKPRPKVVEPPRVEADLEAPVRPYSMKETYAPGDRIDHPKFGEGLVESLPDTGKIEVYFETGRKLLAVARPPRKLQPFETS